MELCNILKNIIVTKKEFEILEEKILQLNLSKFFEQYSYKRKKIWYYRIILKLQKNLSDFCKKSVNLLKKYLNSAV